MTNDDATIPQPPLNAHPMASSTSTGESVNVGQRLSAMAERMPSAVAIVMPRGRKGQGKRQYDQVSFAQLEEDTNRLAAGLVRMGVTPGMRLALMVPPSIDFIALTFAVLKSGAVAVLIDPGMGRRSLLRCLDEVRPEGFVGIPLVHAVRTLMGRRFAHASQHVTVGRRWWWGGTTIDELRDINNQDVRLPTTRADDPAAIIFTTGSTGPPKGVLYRHGNFDMQVEQIRDRYKIQPGDIDLPGFPLFGLFNCAMGVTTVIPDMDPTRPARVDPRNILAAASEWQVTQSFGSPAIWNAVGRFCETHGERLPTVRRILSAGAPVAPDVLERMTRHMHPDGEMHTPYGATEALPVASISAAEVLGETAARTRTGAGTCVGRRFSRIQWKVIEIDDRPIASLDAACELPAGSIGELIVSGPVVTTEYVTRVEANALSKIQDGEDRWHRMGDIGYLDEQDRFWFCGRKAHRVLTTAGPLYTVPCEAIFNQHQSVFRSALVGVGKSGEQIPVIIVECEPHAIPATKLDRRTLFAELRSLGAAQEHTQRIEQFLVHASLPVDIRHNAKIFRERLGVWAERRLARQN